MEIMHRLYRDPKTGKVYRQIGGQEPMELDEAALKVFRIDVDSVPFLKEPETQTVICPNCGNAVIKGKFCAQCGARLDNE